MRRQEDIRALVVKAELQLQAILKEYNNSLQEREIAASLRVDIKNYCENLRSVLDYVALGIRQKNCPAQGGKPRLYFPIVSNPQVFESQAAKWFPGLKQKAPFVWKELEKCQPYQSGYEWLGRFNKVNNANKHVALVPQTCQERGSRVDAYMDGGGRVSWDPSGAIFGDGVCIGGVPVNPLTQLPEPDSRLKVVTTVWIDFQFEGIEGSAIQLLKDAFKGVQLIRMSLEQFI